MMAHPLALQLRNLQSLVEIGVDKNTTVVFPAPLMTAIAELALVPGPRAGRRQPAAADRRRTHPAAAGRRRTYLAARRYRQRNGHVLAHRQPRHGIRTPNPTSTAYTKENRYETKNL